MISSFVNYIFGYNKTNTSNNTNQIDKLCKKLPYELKNIIFEYDGRIEYRYKKKNAIDYHKFVNVIHKYDERYNIIIPIINKKRKIMKETDTRPNDTSFYFEFAFDKQSKYVYVMYRNIPTYYQNYSFIIYPEYFYANTN